MMKNPLIVKSIFMGLVILLLNVTSVFAQTISLPDLDDRNLKEVIHYHIKKIGIKAGEAWLKYYGQTELEGQPVKLIVFEAKGLNFFDHERIYVDPDTYLPIKVYRDLDIWGKKEFIVEHYDHTAGQIRISKTVADKTTETVIDKKGSIENIYGFIFKTRHQKNLRLNDSFEIRLPTKDVTMRVEKKDRLKAAGESFEAFFMRSDPSEYTVWFADQPSLIPLRIDGAVGLGKTAMIMVAYQAEK